MAAKPGRMRADELLLKLLEKESIIEILRTLKKNFSSLLDALFIDDVDKLINCLLRFVLIIVPDRTTAHKFHTTFKTTEAREIYKKILKQLSSRSNDDNISNLELLKYFKSNIDDIINNKKLIDLILKKNTIHIVPIEAQLSPFHRHDQCHRNLLQGLP
jgi:hypothetical protein